METQNNVQQKTVDQIYDYTTHLLVNEKKRGDETTKALIEKGLDMENASHIVSNLEQQIRTVKKERANKDMLYGALWCVGGIVATAANIGFIFWGAIAFGAVQFIKGAVNS